MYMMLWYICWPLNLLSTDNANVNFNTFVGLCQSSAPHGLESVTNEEVQFYCVEFQRDCSTLCESVARSYRKV